jgi:hypothetical protein
MTENENPGGDTSQGQDASESSTTEGNSSYANLDSVNPEPAWKESGNPCSDNSDYEDKSTDQK